MRPRDLTRLHAARSLLSKRLAGMTDYSHSSNGSVCEVTDFESTNPINTERIDGEPFGNYTLVGEIATGGMAEVFLGVRKGLEGFLKVVVVKRVLPHFSGNEQFIRMFVDEARIAARLDHPNIVRTYEFGEVDGRYFTVMEYLAGEDLRSVLRELARASRWLPIHVVVGIVMRLCAGLHCAHQLTDTNGRPLGLVHRDIGPANIVITYGGEVKIIDFGVAKTNTTETVTGTIKGKLAYMPPEQVLAQGVDQRSDIFSAGVVLWELLTGRRLFGRKSDAATLYAIVDERVTPPSRYRSDIPRELDAIVMRALARAPVDRYDTAEDMSDALERFMTSQPAFDARVLAGIVESLFGTQRANAKRAIAQTRSLDHNISLVMKTHTGAGMQLVAGVETLASGSTSNVVPAVVPAAVKPRSRARAIAGNLLILACLAGGVAFGIDATRERTSPVVAPSPGAVLVDSVPRGAAISLDGEPTGLTTPATLSGIAARHVTVRLELLGFALSEHAIDVPRVGTLEQKFTLEKHQ